jgi:Skp family chaperone for outer membrane proteins
MKYLKLAILLTITCFSTFEISAQNKTDSISIQRDQVKNIYTGLKQSEAYREYYYDCLQASNDLNQVINKQDQELQKLLTEIKLLSAYNEALNKKIIDSSVSIEKIKNKKIPWYLHPITYGLLGFAGGIYLMK